jgi:hypothetical protein
VATPKNQSTNLSEKSPNERRAGDVRQNGDSIREGTVSDNIGPSFVYLMCLCFCIFVLFYFCFIHAFCRIVSCITFLYFWKHTQAFRLGGELSICPMTIGQSSDAWNTQLISECLLGNGGYTYLNYFLQRPYTVFTKTVTGQVWDPFETR